VVIPALIVATTLFEPAMTVAGLKGLALIVASRLFTCAVILLRTLWIEAMSRLTAEGYLCTNVGSATTLAANVKGRRNRAWFRNFILGFNLCKRSTADGKHIFKNVVCRTIVISRLTNKAHFHNISLDGTSLYISQTNCRCCVLTCYAAEIHTGITTSVSSRFLFANT
jgi:hypothetical protein